MPQSEVDFELEAIDFSTFVISLGSSVAVQLDPSKPEFDLMCARNTIDILSMLEMKTAGNLTAEEQALLQDILTKTKVAYADAKKSED